MAKKPPTTTVTKPEPAPARCGLCGRLTPLAPGRSICPDCAFFPLD